MTPAKKFFKKNQTAFLLTGIIILFLAIFIPVKLKEGHRDTNTPVVLTSEIKILQSIEPDARAEVVVPILMYHHIRNYNDPKDTIGTNLSVPIENFDAQIKYLKENGYSTITFADFVAFPGKKLPEKPVIVTFDDGYDDAYTNAYRVLKNNGDVAVFYIISSFMGRDDIVTVSQIKEMSDNGMEIGSHTVDHPDLTTISATKLKSELTKSKTAIEAIIGKSVISFCYPSGKNNSLVDTATKDVGYTTATTTVSGVSTTSSDKFALPRIRITATDNLTTFANKLAGK